MTMTTLSSEGRLRALCGGMIKRNRSNMLYFGVLLFVLYPLQYILHIFDENFNSRLFNYANGFGSLNLLGVANAHHTDSTAILLCIAVFVMTLVIGLGQFSYLHSKKAVDVYHELPVNRSTLALANVLAGFATVMIPLTANYLVVLVIGLLKRAITPAFPLIVGGLLIDLVCWAVVVFAVLCIIAFVAVQVGSIFDNFLFSCELLVVCPAVIYLTLNLFQQLLRGFSYSNSDYRWLLYTSPITLMAEHYSSGYDVMFADQRYMRGLLMIGIWLVLAIGLLWLTMRLYRKRPSEIAESSTSRCPLAQVGVLAGTYLGGTVCGLLFSGVTGRMDERWSFTMWTIIFSVLIYVLAQVILLRGFKGIKKALLPGAITVGFIAAFCIVLSTGGLGYETRIPAPADVASVSVNYRGRYSDTGLLLAETKTPYEDSSMPGVTLYRYNRKGDVDMDTPEGIAAVQRLHTVASDRSLDYTVSGNRRWTSRLIITYTLQNGKQLVRNYDYNELSAVESELIALENTEEFKRETHPVFLMDAKSYGSFIIDDALGLYTAQITSQADMQRIMDALEADMLAEDLTELEHSTELAPCSITFMPAIPVDNLQLTQDAYNSGYVVVRSCYTNTLQVLEQLGLAQMTAPQMDDIGSVRVYYESGGYHGGESPIMMSANTGAEAVDFTKNMHYNYDPENNDMVAEVTDPAHLAQIKANLFNIGCVNGSTMTVTIYNKEGGFAGYLQIQPDDLPEKVLAVFPDWVQEEYAYQYDMPAVAYEIDAAATVGVIGGADGPTEIYATK